MQNFSTLVDEIATGNFPRDKLIRYMTVDAMRMLVKARGARRQEWHRHLRELLQMEAKFREAESRGALPYDTEVEDSKVKTPTVLDPVVRALREKNGTE